MCGSCQLPGRLSAISLDMLLGGQELSPSAILGSPPGLRSADVVKAFWQVLEWVRLLPDQSWEGLEPSHRTIPGSVVSSRLAGYLQEHRWVCVGFRWAELLVNHSWERLKLTQAHFRICCWTEVGWPPPWGTDAHASQQDPGSARLFMNWSWEGLEQSRGLFQHL